MTFCELAHAVMLNLLSGVVMLETEKGKFDLRISLDGIPDTEKYPAVYSIYLCRQYSLQTAWALATFAIYPDYHLMLKTEQNDEYELPGDLHLWLHDPQALPKLSETLTRAAAHAILLKI